MKKVLLSLFMLGIALLCTLGTVVTVDARPEDTGYRSFRLGNTDNPLWIDSNGIYWDIFMTDSYSSSVEDDSTIYAFNSNSDETISNFDHFYSTMTTSINFRKGIATFKSLELDLLVTFDTAAGTYSTYGSRKNGDLRYSYRGPATIKGTITIGTNIYPIEGTVSGNCFVNIIDQHSIVK